MTTIRDYFRQTVGRLAPLGSEVEDTARIIFEDVAGYDRNYIFVNGDREILDFTMRHISDAVERVLAGEPVQYVVGKARFMGMDFTVTQDVLIPRPETEGLVDMITDRWEGKSDLRVLDVCTGSGCIAVALSRALPFARVDGIDISDGALAVAKKNATNLHAGVDFRKADALSLRASSAPEYDIIVSNPPYVCESEKVAMDDRVLSYEPALAIFVPDSDPLIFYDAIADYARKTLRPSGQLFFEINPRFAKEISEMLSAKGFTGVGIFRDYLGAERYAAATQSSES